MTAEVCYHSYLALKLQELVLHSLFENDERELYHLEGHIKDEIEAKEAKVALERRKFRQAYKDVVSFRYLL